MKNNPFNKDNPFSVPEGYFDTFQERILSRIQEEKQPVKSKGNVISMRPYKTLVAAAACIAIIFAAAIIYHQLGSSQQSVIAQSGDFDDEAFAQWVYCAEGASLLAESLNLNKQESSPQSELLYSEEQEQEIIYFLERDNIAIATIVNSISDNTLYD